MMSLLNKPFEFQIEENEDIQLEFTGADCHKYAVKRALKLTEDKVYMFLCKTKKKNNSPMWNIVGACQECNLRKSNYLVNLNYLEQLLKRNTDPAFQKKFEEIILSNFIDVESMNRELRQHYDQCSIYFDFLKQFKKN